MALTKVSMAKSKKKSSSAAKSAVRKPRPARKLQAKKAKSKNPPREKKIAHRLPKTNLERTESPAALLLGLNHREKKLDPFVRKQKQNLLQLRDAVVDSMAGVAHGTFARVLKAAKLPLSECIRPTPDR